MQTIRGRRPIPAASLSRQLGSPRALPVLVFNVMRGMSAGGAGGPASWGLMRSFRRDESVKSKQLPKGIVKRIAGFARPYRLQLVIFLGLIVLSALVGAANPL